MDEQFKKIKKLTKFMKEQGLISVKSQDLELTLAPQAIFHVEQNLEPTKDEPLDTPQYTAEELLFWSSPGLIPDGDIN